MLMWFLGNILPHITKCDSPIQWYSGDNKVCAVVLCVIKTLIHSYRHSLDITLYMESVQTHPPTMHESQEQVWATFFK